MRELGSAADANSIWEIELARKAGFQPADIVFTGVGKSSAELEWKAGLQLTLVRYPHHRVQPVDWVQNLADIDSQKVIWANDLGPQANQELIKYFKDRRVWLVEPDKTPPQISPYPIF